MIFYIDFEHRQLEQTDAELAQQVAMKRLRAKYRFEELTREECLIIRYDRFRLSMLELYRPRCVVCSGHNSEQSFYSESEVMDTDALLRDLPVPMLAICGSFQRMMQLRGGLAGPMEDAFGRNWRETGDERLRERGVLSVRLRGLGLLSDGDYRFRQNHYWEVKELGNDFSAVGSSDRCSLQMVRHRSLPVFGVQFHPEEYTDEESDGRLLLARIFAVLMGSPNC